jgi:hypothetical protein
MDPRRIPKVQTFINSLCFTETCQLADEVMEMGSIKAVTERLGLNKIIPATPRIDELLQASASASNTIAS